MIIAIDGPAGVGKSSIAQACAKAFSLTYINSGLLYRIITLCIIRNTDEKDEVNSACFTLEFARITTPITLQNLYNTYMADEQLYAQCYSMAVDRYVSEVSAVLEVRAMVNQAIVLLEQGNDCIVEGRDIASEVHRNANLKLYLDAKIEARAQRRAEQQGINYEIALQNIKKRDTIDYQKEVGQLKISKDTYIVDTTYLTFSEAHGIVCQYIAQVLCKKKL